MSLTKREFEQLTTAVDWSIRQHDTPRRKRVEAVCELVGQHYSDSGAEHAVPVNMIKLGTQIYVRFLAARAPRALITTRFAGLRPTAANLELAVNDIPMEVGLEAALRRLVLEALFGIGVARVGLHRVGEVMGEPYGRSFIEIITADDYFVDMSAKSRDQIQFEGHDYWLKHDTIRDLGWLSKKELAELDDGAGKAIGESGQERADAIGSGGGSVESFKQRLWVRDVWLPDERRLVTYAVKGKKRLHEFEWEGPKSGPYHVLGFAEVPGNLLPLPPVAIWRDLHELSNALFRKLGCEADDQKKVLGFTGGNDESVQNFKKAKDGEGIQYAGAEPKTLTAGGVEPGTLAFFLKCRELSSYFSGNLDALGGLAPQTETLGQDKLLTESASAQLRDMQGQTISVVREIFRSLAWYEWHDPVRERTLEKPVPGLPGMTIPVQWNSDSRQGDFSEFDLDIDVYSLVDDSPALKLQRIGLIMQTYVLPLLPEIQRQGGEFDVQRFLNLLAKYSDLQELEEIVVFATEPQSQDAGQQASAGPAETKRTYEHTSQPGAPSQGDDMINDFLSQAGVQ